jgi:hypothetical protein
MEIGATVWRKDGMAECELLNPFLVWSEDHLNLTPVGARNLDPLFFPSLNDFQLKLLSCDIAGQQSGFGTFHGIARRN